MSSPEDKKPFRIGLCLAGAATAGAYSSGVMDYLMESLDAWEKKRGEPNVPSHRVVIPIMGGASAGGMVSLITASGINNAVSPVDPIDNDPATLLDEYPERKLYHAWVDLSGKDHFLRMLDTADISPGKVTSLFNSKFIDVASMVSIRADTDRWLPTPSYFEKPLKIFVTLTNMQGYDYNVDFNSARRKEKFNMSIHNDYACFEISGEEKDENTTEAREEVRPSPSSKGWMPLNFKTGESIGMARDAAMATGAFPFALRARCLTRPANAVNEMSWLKDIFSKNPLPAGPAKSLIADGGIVNNEPFGRLRDVLNEITIAENPSIYNNSASRDDLLEEHNSMFSTFDNTVLLIDPFPPKKTDSFDFSDELISFAKKMLDMAITQMRALPADYRAAMDTDDASQFLISPSRLLLDDKGKVVKELFGGPAMASGSLSGFGGVLSKEFRIHDYYLGRHNCEVFLRKYFTIPEPSMKKNKIFRDGYAGLEDNEDYFVRNADGVRCYPIIPLFTPKLPPLTMHMPKFSNGKDWPEISLKDLNKFEDPIRARVQKVILNLAKVSWFTGTMLWLGAKLFLNRMITNQIMLFIKNSLQAWELLDIDGPSGK